MLRSLAFSCLFFVISVAGCGHKHKTCSPTDGIHGIFFMFDGSGAVTNPWSEINFSSPRDYCQVYARNLSWNCFGDRDPCLVGWQEGQGENCPSAEEELLPPKWNNESFDAASARILTKFQSGWPRPWGYLKNVSETWIDHKKTVGLPEDARALVIFHSYGAAHDNNVAEEATEKFKEARLKFYGITPITDYTDDYDFVKFYRLMDHPLKPDFIEETELDEKVVDKIIDEGCKL